MTFASIVPQLAALLLLPAPAAVSASTLVIVGGSAICGQRNSSYNSSASPIVPSLVFLQVSGGAGFLCGVGTGGGDIPALFYWPSAVPGQLRRVYRAPPRSWTSPSGPTTSQHTTGRRAGSDDGGGPGGSRRRQGRSTRVARTRRRRRRRRSPWSPRCSWLTCTATAAPSASAARLRPALLRGGGRGHGGGQGIHDYRRPLRRQEAQGPRRLEDHEEGLARRRQRQQGWRWRWWGQPDKNKCADGEGKQEADKKEEEKKEQDDKCGGNAGKGKGGKENKKPAVPVIVTVVLKIVMAAEHTNATEGVRPGPGRVRLPRLGDGFTCALETGSSSSAVAAGAAW